MSDKLAEWEAEAKGRTGEIWSSCDATGLDAVSHKNERILTLIDLVRKKDEALMNAIEATEEDRFPSLRRMYSAVLLTKDLK